jgi:hypothetical protein
MEQARRSDRPMAACRCATPSRWAAGPTIFLQEARGAQPHRSMPPYLAFQLYSVASEMPCLRANSAVFAPASCSFSTPMICSSVNRARFICPSFEGPDSNSVYRKRLRHAGIKLAPQGRPLPGTFASGWKHRMDGGWERRL